MDLNPVNYDKYSSSVSSGTSRSSGSALPPGFGMYDFEESYSNREALMGGYNIDQDEVERIYAELMPKDAGIPVPVVESKSETVVEEVKEDSVEEESDAASAFMRQASTSEEQTKPAAVMESVSTSKTETSKKESSSESPKDDKKGGSKEAFLGFVDKVSSIKPEDVTNAVKSVTTKENLDKAAELAKDTANKVQASFENSEGGNAIKLPGGTRRVSPQDDDFGEGTVIRKKK